MLKLFVVHGAVAHGCLSASLSPVSWFQTLCVCGSGMLAGCEASLLVVWWQSMPSIQYYSELEVSISMLVITVV